jgi:signal transduction histidine kinase
MREQPFSRVFVKFWIWLNHSLYWQGKLRNKVLLMVLALTALPFVFFTILGIQKGASYIYEKTQSQNQVQVEQFAGFIDTCFENLVQNIQKALFAKPSQPLRDALWQLRGNSFYLLRVTLSNQQGMILTDTNSPNAMNTLTHAFIGKDYHNPAGPLQIGAMLYDPEFKAPTIPLRIPLASDHPNAQPLTVIIYPDLTVLADLVSRWSRTPAVEMILVDAEGRVLKHPRLLPGNPAYASKIRAYTRPGKRDSQPVERNDLHQPIFRSFAYCRALRCYIILEQKNDVIFQSVNHLRRILLTFLAGALLFSLCGGIWYVSRLVSPLEELEAGIQLLESGLLAEPIPVRSQDEIGRLTQTFNQMAQSLIARNEEIRGKNRKLSFFNEITRIINQSIDLNTILDKSLLKILQLMHASAAWIHVFDPHVKQLNLVAHSGLSERLAAHLEHPDGSDNIIIKTFVSGKPLLVRDVPQQLEHSGNSSLERVRDLLLVPLRSKKTILGVLAIGSRRKYFFHYQDLELLSRIGDELGIAVENALLYLELQLKIRELEDVNKDLQELDRFKNRILSNVSHELRTPITSIKTYVELFLCDKIGSLDTMQKEKLLIVQRNINHLLNLINDLLTLARIQDQKIQLKHMEMFVAQELVDVVIADTIEMARAKGLQMSRQGAAQPMLVRANRQKLQQVLQNLISNAIKFTEAGSITVDLKVLRGMTAPADGDSSEPRACDFVEVSVIDTGIGIPKKVWNKIFQRFYQVDSSSTRKYVGTGLGLAIVKEILEAHESEIHVESKIGQGSRFWFCLPVVNIREINKKPAAPSGTTPPATAPLT